MQVIMKHPNNVEEVLTILAISVRREPEHVPVTIIVAPSAYCLPRKRPIETLTPQEEL